AKFPRFKSKHHKQSIQYPQSVTVKDEYLKVPKIGEVKAVFHREVTRKIKTVTISKSSTDKYFASILCEVEVTDVKRTGDQIIGIDLGLKDFAIVHDGERVTKYANPKHLNRHQKNLALKQKKLSRKTQGSKSRKKFRKKVANVYERIANSRQDFLHKLSRKLVDESQVIVVE
ncbi:putative transposase family protein, partial [Lyngbya aestuarii BL J]